ncbi:MAG: peptidase M3, partial [Myxococcales bacterium]
FIDQVAVDALPAAEREIAELRELAGEEIDSSSWRHAVQRMKATRFDVDARTVRSYFDFPSVRQGLLDVTGRLFGLSYEPVEVSTWHVEVASYDVLLGGDVIGRVHLDLHPREGKYNHAAQFDLVPGVAGRQLPEGVLVCNFPRGLMDHDDVVTLFHEFGHLLHHVLAGGHHWVSFSGVATEWDFVEAPSQLLEEWAWDANVLATFARNADGEPIPADLVERMRAAEDFGKAFLARTQMFYAAVSYRFHLERPADLTTRLLELQREYSMLPPLPDTHFHTGFGHLEGYTSAYYTYMWSLVIAKDLFSAFDSADLFAPEVALRYRDLILAAGGSEDAAD